MAAVELKNVTIHAEGDHGIIEYEFDFLSHDKEFGGPSYRKGSHILNGKRKGPIFIEGPNMNGEFYGTIFIPKDLIVQPSEVVEVETKNTFGIYEVHATFRFFHSDSFTMHANIQRK